MSLLVGAIARLKATFSDVNGLADPDVVTATVLKPDGTTVTPAVTRDSLGLWHADVPVTLPGPWSYKWSGAGTVAAVGEGYFIVPHSLVIP